MTWHKFVGVDYTFEKEQMEKNEPAIMTAINKAMEKMNHIIEYCGVKFFYDERTGEYCFGNSSWRSADQFKWVLMRNAQ